MAQDYVFKEMIFSPIKGAPELSAPQFLLNEAGKPITAEKRGHALPALFDWDGDGVKDLLVGEFGNGNDANLLVYKNVGTKKKPVYAEKPFYATDNEGVKFFIDGT